MGIYLCLIISIFHFVAYLIKACIFDRGYKAKNSIIKIPWLCNLRVTDPYDLEPHKKSNLKKKNKGKESIKLNRVTQIISVVQTDLDNSVTGEDDNSKEPQTSVTPGDSSGATMVATTAVVATNMKISTVTDLMANSELESNETMSI